MAATRSGTSSPGLWPAQVGLRGPVPRYFALLLLLTPLVAGAWLIARREPTTRVVTQIIEVPYAVYREVVISGSAPDNSQPTASSQSSPSGIEIAPDLPDEAGADPVHSALGAELAESDRDDAVAPLFEESAAATSDRQPPLPSAARGVGPTEPPATSGDTLTPPGNAVAVVPGTNVYAPAVFTIVVDGTNLAAPPVDLSPTEGQSKPAANAEQGQRRTRAGRTSSSADSKKQKGDQSSVTLGESLDEPPADAGPQARKSGTRVTAKLRPRSPTTFKAGTAGGGVASVRTSSTSGRGKTGPSE